MTLPRILFATLNNLLAESANFCGSSCTEYSVGRGEVLTLPRILFATLNNCLAVVHARIYEEKNADLAR